jgi:hypothetical protein
LPNRHGHRRAPPLLTIPRVARALQTVLAETADALARSTGFLQRQRKFTGSRFVQMLVFGLLEDPDASLEQLAQTAAAAGVVVRRQSVAERFTPQAAALLRGVLQAAVLQLLAAAPVAIPLLRRFAAVVAMDSSTVGLPEALAGVWSGKGSRDPHAGNAAVKLTVGLDLLTGRLHGPELQAGRTPDSKAPLVTAPLPAGSLRLTDLGYFDLKAMAELDRRGVYWLTRLKAGTKLFTADGRRQDSVATLLATHGTARVELAVMLGVTQRLRCRLLAERVPPEVAEARRRRLHEDAQRQRRRLTAETLALAAWTVLVTNAPAAKLSLPEALVLKRARWQIELLFKLWKGHGHIDESASADPDRVLCAVYAKLLAMVVQHWMMLLGDPSRPDRSPVQAAKTVRAHAFGLLGVLGRFGRLCEALGRLADCLRSGCQMGRRRKAPHTYQLLLGMPSGP